MNCLLKEKIGILFITESKLDSSFTTIQFLIDGLLKPFRFDKNRNGVGVLLYLREDLACRELKSDNLPNDVEGIFIELNIRKAKYLLFSIYDSPAHSDDYYFSHVSNCLDAFSST